MYSGHNVVKVYNGTREAIKEFNELNNKLYEANRNFRRITAARSAVPLILQPVEHLLFQKKKIFVYSEVH